MHGLAWGTYTCFWVFAVHIPKSPLKTPEIALCWGSDLHFGSLNRPLTGRVGDTRLPAPKALAARRVGRGVERLAAWSVVCLAGCLSASHGQLPLQQIPHLLHLACIGARANPSPQRSDVRDSSVQSVPYRICGRLHGHTWLRAKGDVSRSC